MVITPLLLSLTLLALSSFRTPRLQTPIKQLGFYASNDAQFDLEGTVPRMLVRLSHPSVYVTWLFFDF